MSQSNVAYLLTNLCKLPKWLDYVHTVTKQKISLYHFNRYVALHDCKMLRAMKQFIESSIVCKINRCKRN